MAKKIQRHQRNLAAAISAAAKSGGGISARKWRKKWRRRRWRHRMKWLSAYPGGSNISHQLNIGISGSGAMAAAMAKINVAVIGAGEENVKASIGGKRKYGVTVMAAIISAKIMAA
jgi:hypothetical protein